MKGETRANRHFQKSPKCGLRAPVWIGCYFSSPCGFVDVRPGRGLSKAAVMEGSHPENKGAGFICCRNSRKSGSDSECQILNFLLIHDTDISLDI